jgi:hypothetical protein
MPDKITARHIAAMIFARVDFVSVSMASQAH